jgi:hypothetical protein
MDWLFLLLAILGLAFPPVGAIILAMVVLGVFAKGVAADPEEPIAAPRRKGCSAGTTRRPHEAMPSAVPPQRDSVIDVRWYPVPPPPRLPTPEVPYH